MPGNTAVKSTARTALKGFWPQAVAASLWFLAVCSVLMVLLSVNSTLFGVRATVLNIILGVVFAFLFAAPCFLGLLRFFRRAVYGNTDSYSSLFYYFSDRHKYKKTVWFFLMLVCRIGAVGLLTFSPYFIIRIIELLPFRFVADSLFLQFSVIRFIMYLIGAIFFLIANLRYYIAPMLFVSCDDMHWTEIIYVSKHISRYSSGPFLVLIIGFSGWFLLSLFGVTLIYTMPYMLTAYVVHCRFAFSHYNHNVELMKKTDFPKYRSTF